MDKERRQGTRQKSLLRGLAYLGNSPSAIDCVVRDVSETGARLNFASPLTVPDTLELHIPAKGQKLRAEVQWREPNEVGIAFISEGADSASAKDDNLAARVARLEAEITALKQMIKRLQRSTNANTDAA